MTLRVNEEEVEDRMEKSFWVFMFRIESSAATIQPKLTQGCCHKKHVRESIFSTSKRRKYYLCRVCYRDP